MNRKFLNVQKKRIEILFKGIPGCAYQVGWARWKMKKENGKICKLTKQTEKSKMHKI